MLDRNEVYRSPRRVTGEYVDEEVVAIREKMQQLAWIMDEAIELPGTGLKIGLDGILGLLPGVGDLIAAAISTYFLRLAARLKIPRVVMVRMGLNIFIDLVIGAVPIVGDMFDVAWKANRKNVDLVMQHLNNPERLRRHSWAQVICLSAICVILTSAVAWAGFALIAWLFG